jgi:hypothetical protein
MIGVEMRPTTFHGKHCIHKTFDGGESFWIAAILDPFWDDEQPQMETPGRSPALDEIEELEWKASDHPLQFCR